MICNMCHYVVWLVLYCVCCVCQLNQAEDNDLNDLLEVLARMCCNTEVRTYSHLIPPSPTIPPSIPNLPLFYHLNSSPRLLFLLFLLFYFFYFFTFFTFFTFLLFLLFLLLIFISQSVPSSLFIYWTSSAQIVSWVSYRLSLCHRS